MNNSFTMNSYELFIWLSYVVGTSVFVLLATASIRSLKHKERALEMLQATSVAADLAQKYTPPSSWKDTHVIVL